VRGDPYEVSKLVAVERQIDVVALVIESHSSKKGTGFADSQDILNLQFREDYMQHLGRHRQEDGPRWGIPIRGVVPTHYGDRVL
jgi:hypothetical protein